MQYDFNSGIGTLVLAEFSNSRGNVFPQRHPEKRDIVNRTTSNFNCNSNKI